MRRGLESLEDPEVTRIASTTAMSRSHVLNSRNGAPLYTLGEAAAGWKGDEEEVEGGRSVILDLQKLETFRVVASTLSFTRAGLELGYCQSSITMHIKALERELGVVLFDRCRFSKDVILTEAGRVTLEYATRLLTLAEEARTAVLRVPHESGQALSLVGS